MIQQSSLLNKVDGRMQGIGENFLEFIEENKKWQEGYKDDNKRWQIQIIDAIHQDKRDGGEGAFYRDDLTDAREQQLQAKLLARLRFAEMTDRQVRIAEAYEKTFEWIFREPASTGSPWTDFTQWLELGSSLYWITGKAGSGKSTLIKYVYQDSRTFEYLKKWAAGVSLVTAAYFFWNSGTSMQMSQQGLLQSILYQILSSCPKFIPHILPRRWEAYVLFGDDHFPINELELRQAFRLLTKEDPLATKFCLFIDGLDEFDGDHSNLIDFIKDIAGSTNIKVCVSSRPWVVFEDAFANGPSLMLQDLTYPDIMHFIMSMFSRNEGFRELQKREPEYAGKLLEDIGQKAAGVFLWVHLVVHSLLAGLVNGDRVSDLQRRLAFLPPDLENLYQKILDGLDPFYLEHASQLFQLIRIAQQPPSVLRLSFADEDPDFFLHCKTEPLGEDQISTRIEVIKRRLNSCCKGLLEVAPNTDTFEVTEDSYISASASVIYRAHSTVQYLHGTVKDFLENRKTWNRLMATRSHDYDPHLAMSKSYLLQLKLLYTKTLPRKFFWKIVEKCLYYASLAQPGSGGSLVSVLDELDRTAAELAIRPAVDGSSMMQRYLVEDPYTVDVSFHLRNFGILQPHWTCTMYNSVDSLSGLTFLSLAVRLDLYVYVKARLKSGCLVKQDTGIWPLLSDAITTDEIANRPAFPNGFPSRMMVKLLLDNGADPNRVIPNQGWTVWEKVLWQRHKGDVDLSVWLHITSQFLTHGASLHAISGSYFSNDKSSGWQVGGVFQDFLKSQKPQRWFSWGVTRSRENKITDKDIEKLMELLL
jgi:hypothetical protein